MKKIIHLLLSTSFLIGTAHAQMGTLDTSFDPGTSVQEPSAIEAVALRSDQSLIAVGGFLTYNGDSSKNIVGILPDGSRDLSFNVGTGFTSPAVDISGSSGRCHGLAIQPDGKILVGGFFTSYNGTPVNRIARLNADGSLDEDFNIGTGFNNAVQCIAVQADGKILCGGAFTSFNGTPRNRLARLNQDGTLDTEYVTPGVENTLWVMALQPDGRLIIGGTFTTFGTTSVGRIARVDTDGSLDESFVQGTGFNALVMSLHVLSDGRIMAGGGFLEYDGNTRTRIIRLMPDGSIDPGFSSFASASDQVRTILEDEQGNYVVTGNFQSVNSTPSRRVARLTPDGGLDAFSPGEGFNNTVQDAVIQADGKLVAGGYFTGYDGTEIRSIARVHMSSTSGLSEIKPVDVSLFPNPASGTVHLRTELDGPVHVTVVDANGRLVYENMLTGVGPVRTLDLGHVASGNYLLNIRTVEGSAVRSLVIGK